LIEEVKNWKSKWWTDNYLQILLDKEYKSWELVEVEVNENNCIF
jgi:hypothetical protein